MKADTLQNAKSALASDVVTESLIPNWLKVVVIILVALLIIYFAIVYLTKKKIHVKLYSKLLIIMGDLEKNYDLAVQYFDSGDYDMAIVIIRDIEHTPRLADELKSRCTEFKKKIQRAIDKQQVDELQHRIEVLISSSKFKEAKELLLNNRPKSKSDYDTILSRIHSAEVVHIKKTIECLIQESKIKDAYNYFREILTKFPEPKYLKDVDAYLRSYIQTELPKLIDKNEIENVEDIIGAIENIIQYRNIPLISDLKVKAKNKLFSKVSELVTGALEKYEISEAQQILDEYRTRLRPSDIVALNRQISDVRNSKVYISQKLRKQVIPLANASQFESAYKLIENAEKSYKEDFSSLRKEVDDIKEKQKFEAEKQRISDIISRIKVAIEKNELGTIQKELEALNISLNTDISLRQVFAKEYDILCTAYNSAKLLNDIEDSFYGDYPLLPIGTLNVEKKAEAGEDADPILNVQTGRNWGILGVFDGMGGAGARKYTHNLTKEEHTSAYWASRFVRDAVERLMSSRPIGTNPIEYIEKEIHRAIKNKLDSEILNFPAAASTVASKLLAKLPTTMALCAYQIVDSHIDVSCYWAGDSRVYMFDGEKFHFLTVDDADAPDGDPFSPANMDLAMNNKICQDHEYRINKSSIRVEMDPATPIVLFAATDGCFGYYKNPIEFENMILSVMYNFDAKQWITKIKDAIIDNIQQDDFSMSAVLIGNEDCKPLRNHISNRLSKAIFSEYLLWRNQERREQDEIIKQVDDYGTRIEEKLERLKDIKDSLEDIGQKINSLSNVFESIVNTLQKYSSSDKIPVENEPIYTKLKELLLIKQREETDLNRDIADLREARNNLKMKLEQLQLKSQTANNEWYAKYKSFINIIQPSQTI